jgi:hypothetical protein
MDDHHRKCRCGAIYRRSHAMAPTREMSSFECAVCGTTLESWNTTWVPNYRLVKVTEPSRPGMFLTMPAHRAGQV